MDLPRALSAQEADVYIAKASEIKNENINNKRKVKIENVQNQNQWKKCLFWLIFLLGWTVPLTVKAKDIKIMRWYLIFEVKDLLNIFFVVLDCGTSLWRAHQTQQKKLIWFCLHQENHIYGRHIQKPPFFVSRLLFSCIHSWGICSPAVHQQYNIWILRLQK